MVIALPVLAAFLVALMVLLLLAAALPLAKALATLLRDLPVVGGYVAGVVDAGITAMVRGVTAAYKAASGPLAGFIRAIYTPVLNAYDTIFNALHGAATQFHYIYSTYVPHSVAAAENYAASVAAQVQSWASAAVDAVSSWATARITHAEQVATAEVATAASWAATEIAATRAELAADVGAVSSWAATEIAATRAVALADTDAVIDWATSEIAATRAQAAADATDAYDALAAALDAGVIPAVDAITTTIDRCVNPYCAEKNLLGQGLSRVVTLLEGGALVAFLVAAVADPAEAAAVVGGLFGDVATEASAALHDLAAAA